MTWVNFKELREKLDFRSVLEHYGVTINAKNHVQHHGKCPLPTHSAPNRSSAFSANLEKGIWRCFGCGAQGNILDFAARMEKLDPGKPDDVRHTAPAPGRSVSDRQPEADGPNGKVKEVVNHSGAGAKLMSMPRWISRSKVSTPTIPIFWTGASRPKRSIVLSLGTARGDSCKSALPFRFAMWKAN